MQYKGKAQLDVEYGRYQVFGIARKIFSFCKRTKLSLTLSVTRSLVERSQDWD